VHLRLRLRTAPDPETVHRLELDPDEPITHYVRITTLIDADALAIPETRPMNLLYASPSTNHRTRASLLILAQATARTAAAHPADASNQPQDRSTTATADLYATR